MCGKQVQPTQCVKYFVIHHSGDCFLERHALINALFTHSVYRHLYDLSTQLYAAKSCNLVALRVFWRIGEIHIASGISSCRANTDLPS